MDQVARFIEGQGITKVNKEAGLTICHFKQH